jgi:hypothetical protein
LSFEEFEVRQPRHDEPLLVRLTRADQSGDVFGEHLARLYKLRVIAVLELPEHLHRSRDRPRTNFVFHYNNHGRKPQAVLETKSSEDRSFRLPNLKRNEIWSNRHRALAL